MTSAISSRNTVVFFSVIKRLKWLGILFFTALFFDMPLALWMQLGEHKKLDPTGWLTAVQQGRLEQILFRPMETLLSIGFPIILALVIFYYLQNEKATTFFHSLAIRRRSLYLQSFLAGLVMVWLPLMAAGLLNYLVFKAYGVSRGMWNYVLLTENANSSAAYSSSPIGINGVAIGIGHAMLIWLCLILVMTLLFYTFTIFVGMFTGNILLQAVLTSIGLFLPLAAYYLIEYSLGKMIYGFVDAHPAYIDSLSPIVGYVSLISEHSKNSKWIILAYFIAAIILLVGGICVYARRQAEAAGETLAASWVRGVFKYGVSVCAALTGGVYFGVQFSTNPLALYLGFALGGLLGYIISDMVAYKTFRFYERWKALVVFAVIFTVVVGAVKLDLFGYERRIPETAQVKSAMLTGGFDSGSGSGMGSIKLATAQNIKRVTMLHSAIISMKSENTNYADNQQSYNDYLKHLGDGNYIPSRRLNLNFEYKLQDGSKINRGYTIDASKYEHYLKPIITSSEGKRSMYKGVLAAAPAEVLKININDSHFSRQITIQDTAEKAAALNALKKDVMNLSYEAMLEWRVPQRGSIEIALPGKTKYDITYLQVPYYTEFEYFDAFLKKSGYYDQLVLDAKDVSYLELRQIGADRRIIVKDPARINDILLWGTETGSDVAVKDAMANEQSDAAQQYYAVVYRKDGKLSYMSIENSYWPQKMIYEIFLSAN